MTIQKIQDKLYQYGFNYQYTWTGEIRVYKFGGRYKIFRSWNKVKENLLDFLKLGINPF